MSDRENHVEAVNIGITLSSQIVTASLAVLAILGAFATFALDKKEVGYTYYIFTILSSICLISSILYGGAGINKARQEGFNGNWDISLTKSLFNKQAITILLGTILFVISTFLGQSKSDNIEKDVSNLRISQKALLSKDSISKQDIHKLEQRIDSLIHNVNTLKNSLIEKKVLYQNNIIPCKANKD
jgi:hypothetical protein